MVRGLAELVATLPPEFEWQAENVLNAAGVRAVDADGQVFDPHVHHAVDTEPTPDAALGDTVARTLRRGWVDGDQVMVPARVVVYVAPDRPAVLP
jgi:molecular chaperone GrpE (heat shock protein)